ARPQEAAGPIETSRRTRACSSDPGRDREPERLLRPAPRDEIEGCRASSRGRTSGNRPRAGHAPSPRDPRPPPRGFRAGELGRAASLDQRGAPVGRLPAPLHGQDSRVRGRPRERGAREKVRPPWNRRSRERNPTSARGGRAGAFPGPRIQPGGASFGLPLPPSMDRGAMGDTPRPRGSGADARGGQRGAVGHGEAEPRPRLEGGDPDPVALGGIRASTGPERRPGLDRRRRIRALALPGLSRRAHLASGRSRGRGRSDPRPRARRAHSRSLRGAGRKVRADRGGRRERRARVRPREEPQPRSGAPEQPVRTASYGRDTRGLRRRDEPAVPRRVRPGARRCALLRARRSEAARGRALAPPMKDSVDVDPGETLQETPAVPPLPPGERRRGPRFSFWSGTLLLAGVALFGGFLVMNLVLMPSFTRQGAEVQVPEVTGQSEIEAERVLAAEGLKLSK